MIQQKIIGNLVKTYSDAGYKIIQEQTQNEYNEALDIFPTRYTYIESENLIEVAKDGNKTN